MESKKKRLTLDLDPSVQRRLKAAAAIKGMSMRQYCLAAITRELVKDEVKNRAKSPLWTRSFRPARCPSVGDIWG